MPNHSTTLDLTAEIIPGRSLGGLYLRAPVTSIDPFLKAQHLRGSVKSCLVGMYELRYEVHDAVEVAIDVRNGKIFKLIAREGYLGRLFGSVTVGQTVEQAIRLHPSLFYDEGEGIVRDRELDGVALDFADPDPPASIALQLPVAAISVFAPEATNTAQGQDGNW